MVVCAEEAEEKEKVKSAADCCRRILNYVNQAVKEAENKQVTSHSILQTGDLS